MSHVAAVLGSEEKRERMVNVMQHDEQNSRASKSKASSKPDTAKRQYHRKSRFGCQSCKKRRVKCDETKPVCKRCFDAGVQCSGYLTATLPKSQPPSRPEKLPLIPIIAERSIITWRPSQLVGASVEDRRSFDFFVSETGPMLSGYFDADFWNHFLLQFSHHNTAIWHSVLALSAFHEQRLLIEDWPMQKEDTAHRRFALQHYNQAVRHLTGRLSTGKAPTEIVLASCVLFICIETLMGNLPGAANHIAGGIEILRSWKKDRAKEGSSRLSPKLIENNLVPIFDHINQYSFTHGRAAPPISDVDLTLDEPESECFANILEARTSLLRVISGAQQFTVTFGSSHESQDVTQKHSEHFLKQRLLFRIQRWEVALDELLARPNMAHISDRERRAIALLRVQQNIVWIAISNAKNTDEVSFDAFLSNFEAVVEHAESAAVDTESPTSWSKRWANVNFQMQNMTHLYMTATKCRNPKIRRKALSLLKRLFTRDRLWNMDLVYKMAERVVELEEEGLEELKDAKGDVVPSEWARIYDVTAVPTTVEGHTIELVTYKRRKEGNGKHWREKEEYIGGPAFSLSALRNRLYDLENAHLEAEPGTKINSEESFSPMSSGIYPKTSENSVGGF